MKKIVFGSVAAAVIGIIAAVALPGCAGFSVQEAAQDAVVFCTDGEAVLAQIKDFISTYFLMQPNPSLQAKINDKLAEASAGLDTALRLTSGVKDLTANQVFAAFADFRAAYQDLLGLVQPLGVKVSSSPLVAARISASHGTLTVPKPMAFK